MNGPLCRLAAATCLVVLAMVPGAARAEPIRVAEPGTEYPGLIEKPIDPGEGIETPIPDDTTMIEWPMTSEGSEPAPDQPPVLPVKAEDQLMYTLSGSSEKDCPCVCPPTPTPPTPTPTTPAESAPEPTALVLFGLGSLGLALARRRK